MSIFHRSQSVFGQLGGGDKATRGSFMGQKVGKGADGFYEPKTCSFLNWCLPETCHSKTGARWSTQKDVIKHRNHKSFFTKEVDKFIREFCPTDTVPDKDYVEEAADAMENLDATAFAKALIDITVTEARYRVEEQAKSSRFANQNFSDEYFTATSFHDRDDIYYGKLHNEKYVSTFAANVLIKKYSVPGEELPPHVPIRCMADLVELVSAVTPDSDGTFNITIPEMRQEFYERVREIDWSMVKATVYAVRPWENGEVNSPALNSLWIIHGPPKEGETEGEMLLYNFVSAHVDGEPAMQYLGTRFGAWYESWPDSKFTPLARPDNIYRYRVQDNPLRIDIQVYYKHFPPKVSLEDNWDGVGEFHGTGSQPMLNVHTIFTPALKKTVEEHYGVAVANTTKTHQVLIKACLMYDLMRMYEPTKSDSTLFDRMSLGKASSAESYALGGVMNLFSDYQNWRGALWMIPPTKEALNIDPRKSIRASVFNVHARKSHVQHLQSVAFDASIEASKRGHEGARASLLQHADNAMLAKKLKRVSILSSPLEVSEDNDSDSGSSGSEMFDGGAARSSILGLGMSQPTSPQPTSP